MNNETKQFVQNLAEQYGYPEKDIAKLQMSGYTTTPVIKVGDYCLNPDEALFVLGELVEALNL